MTIGMVGKLAVLSGRNAVAAQAIPAMHGKASQQPTAPRSRSRLPKMTLPPIGARAAG